MKKNKKKNIYATPYYKPRSKPGEKVAAYSPEFPVHYLFSMLLSLTIVHLDLNDILVSPKGGGHDCPDICLFLLNLSNDEGGRAS